MAREKIEDAIRRLMPEVIEEMGGDSILLSVPPEYKNSEMRKRVISKLFLEKISRRHRILNLEYFSKTALNAYARIMGSANV